MALLVRQGVTGENFIIFLFKNVLEMVGYHTNIPQELSLYKYLFLKNLSFYICMHFKKAVSPSHLRLRTIGEEIY